MAEVEFVAGSFFAVVLMFLVVRDLARVNAALAALVSAYCVVVGSLAYRGSLLSTAERLPPTAVIAGQLLLLLLVASTLTRGMKAWRKISLLRFFAWHSIRLPMGILMVVLAYSGRLAPEFGWGAGVGKVIVGLCAAVYVFVPRSRSVPSVVAWCSLGLLDVLVGMTSAVLTFRSPFQQFPHAPQMTVMSAIPMVLVPSFSMAVLTISTFLIFVRREELAGGPVHG